MNFDFPKSFRLLKRTEFKTALSHGVKVVDRFLVVIGEKSDRPHPRMGIIVSKKVGNAVVRNQTKRRLREAFRHHKLQQANLDFVVIARHTAAGLSQVQMDLSFERCLSKLKRKIDASAASV